ncbi:MAG: acyltransferase [Nostocaceae cyanobacterium]|nr:acyltransferase [Nostocaceae cyanobacterium]
MNNHQLFSKWQRLPEFLITSILGWLPTILLGPQLRAWFYHLIISRISGKVYIQHNVELFGVNCIELGNNVYIFKGARIDARGDKNNRLCLSDGVAIERNVEIGCLENTRIYIGEKTFIGPNVCIGGPGDITIGKKCMIAAHTGIIANNHIFSDLLVPIKDQGVTRKGITIEDDCWLGHGVTVLDGITIGKGSVIGAGAVVTKDIPPYSVAVGIPARVIKSRIAKELVNSKE